MTTVVLTAAMKTEAGAEKGLELLRNWLVETRRFDGCFGASCYRNENDPTSITLIEQWASQDHYKTYFAWRTSQPDFGELGAELAGDPQLSFLEPVTL